MATWQLVASRLCKSAQPATAGVYQSRPLVAFERGFHVIDLVLIAVLAGIAFPAGDTKG